MIQLKELLNLFGSIKQAEERKHKNLKLFLLWPHGPEASGETPSSGTAPLHKPNPPCTKVTAYHAYGKYLSI